MPESVEERLEKAKRLLRLLDADYDFYNNWGGNGCFCGFKPAKSCPNDGCKEREANALWDEFWNGEK